MTIDPQILQLLQQRFGGGLSQMPNANDPYVSQDGTYYVPQFDIRYNGEGSPLQSTLTGYGVGGAYNPGTGTQYQQYDTQGNDTGQSYFEKPDDWNWDNYAIAAALGLTGANMLAAGGMGGGSLGAANGSWDAVGGLTGAESAALGSGAPMTATMGAGAAPAASGAGGAAATTATGGGLLSGLGSYLGPAAAVLGALSGAQGQNQSQTSTREPWGPVGEFAKNDIIPAARGLLQQQMQYVPQQGQQISNIGMGLLQQPIAGNGFAQFMQRPHFGG